MKIYRMFSRNKKIMFVLMTNLTSEEKSKAFFFDFFINDNIFFKDYWILLSLFSLFLSLKENFFIKILKLFTKKMC
jgi:hypothetical protein